MAPRKRLPPIPFCPHCLQSGHEPRPGCLVAERAREERQERVLALKETLECPERWADYMVGLEERIEELTRKLAEILPQEPMR